MSGTGSNLLNKFKFGLDQQSTPRPFRNDNFYGSEQQLTSPMVNSVADVS